MQNSRIYAAIEHAPGQPWDFAIINVTPPEGSAPLTTGTIASTNSTSASSPSRSIPRSFRRRRSATSSRAPATTPSLLAKFADSVAGHCLARDSTACKSCRITLDNARRGNMPVRGHGAAWPAIGGDLRARGNNTTSVHNVRSRTDAESACAHTCNRVASSRRCNTQPLPWRIYLVNRASNSPSHRKLQSWTQPARPPLAPRFSL